MTATLTVNTDCELSDDKRPLIGFGVYGINPNTGESKTFRFDFTPEDTVADLLRLVNGVLIKDEPLPEEHEEREFSLGELPSPS